MAGNYRRPRELAESAVHELEQIGHRAVAARGATASRLDDACFVAEAHDSLGSLDILVDNGGILKRTPFLRIDEEE